jgi:hypothetical protein
VTRLSRATPASRDRRETSWWDSAIPLRVPAADESSIRRV